MKNESFARAVMYVLGLAAGIMIGRAIVWRLEAPLDMTCDCAKQYSVQVSTCYPKTYVWGAKAEFMPEQSDVLAAANFDGSVWRRLSFSVYVNGDNLMVARRASKAFALAFSMPELELDTLLVHPTCQGDLR